MSAHQMKVMFLGDKGVGKTTLITRKANPQSTRHLDFQLIKHEIIPGHQVTYTALEVAPPVPPSNEKNPRQRQMEERINLTHARAMAPHFKTADVIAICFDLSNRKSILNHGESIEMAQAFAPDFKGSYVFVATKYDLWQPDNPAHVSENDLNALQEQINPLGQNIFFTSNRDEKSINNLFNTIAAKRFPVLLSKVKDYNKENPSHRWVTDNGLTKIQAQLDRFNENSKKLLSFGAKHKAKLLNEALIQAQEKAGQNQGVPYDYKTDPEIVEALSYHRNILSRLIAFFKTLKTNSLKQLENDDTDSKHLPKP